METGAADMPSVNRIIRRRDLVLAVLGLSIFFWWASQHPSTDRDWMPNLAVMPYTEFRDSLVLIHNVRNTTYATATDYTPAYDDRDYDLRRLESVWFIVEPFSRWGGAAHTFLSFGFEGPEYVTISVEARKERDEHYQFLKGLIRQYELMYVVADERDAIGLRANYREDDVFLYPIKAPRDRVRELFVAMLERANRLREEPEFYNTLTQNCTNTIVQHVNTLVPGRVPFSYKVLLPGYSDEVAYELGLIDTDLPYERIRERYRINEPAARYAGRPDFSIRIREGLLRE